MWVLGRIGQIVIVLSLAIFAGGLNAWYGAIVSGTAGVLFMYWFWSER
jgi:hypothetical protein